MSRRTAIGLLLTVVAVLSTACGSRGSSDQPEKLTVYSGRNERLIGPLLERFEQATGIGVNVRYGGTAELAATLMEEGENTPAALFISQDAAALGALSARGLLRVVPDEMLQRVPEGFRSPRGDWIGLSGRARVIVFNTDRIAEDELPRSLTDVTAPRFHGRFGVAPTNASFQSHMAAYLSLHGSDALDALLRGMADNAPRVYPKNGPIVEAVIAGEIDWGLVNHYYLLRALDERPDAPAANFFMPGDDGSAFLNLAGAGLLQDLPGAKKLLLFLVSDQAQRYFAEETHEFALASPAAAGTPADLGRVDFAAVADSLEPALRLIHDSGLARFQ